MDSDTHDQERLAADLRETFGRLREQVQEVLARFGESCRSPGQAGDYTVRSQYSGFRHVAVAVHSLDLLRPAAVAALKEIAEQFGGWTISVKVAVPGHEDWPAMGLHIFSDGVQDGLQRDYLPQEFQQVEYRD